MASYDMTPTGVWFDFRLVPDGAVFTLYKRKDNSSADVLASRAYLEATRDVVECIQVFDVDNEGNILKGKLND